MLKMPTNRWVSVTNIRNGPFCVCEPMCEANEHFKSKTKHTKTKSLFKFVVENCA